MRGSGVAKMVVFQKGGFGGYSPGTKNGTRVHSDVPLERIPEQTYIRQNRPFTKPPFCLPASGRESIPEPFANLLRCHVV